MKSRQEILRDRYGFNKGSYDYVPKGGEILKLIGQNVIYVEYTKNGEGWDTKFSKAFINSISDFDPLNMTYLTKFKVEVGGENSENYEDREMRMIPEGYSWVDSEDAPYIQRFLPFSMHFKLMEDELFYERLKDLWKERDTLDTNALLGLSTSKDKATTLRYSRHLACVIMLEGSEEPLYFRIHKLGLKHNAGKQYALSIWDGDENPIKTLINSEDKEYDFERGLGKFKIIDIC
jgi:hypothetical protein